MAPLFAQKLVALSIETGDFAVQNSDGALSLLLGVALVVANVVVACTLRVKLRFLAASLQMEFITAVLKGAILRVFYFKQGLLKIGWCSCELLFCGSEMWWFCSVGKEIFPVEDCSLALRSLLNRQW